MAINKKLLIDNQSNRIFPIMETSAVYHGDDTAKSVITGIRTSLGNISNRLSYTSGNVTFTQSIPQNNREKIGTLKIDSTNYDVCESKIAVKSLGEANGNFNLILVNDGAPMLYGNCYKSSQILTSHPRFSDEYIVRAGFQKSPGDLAATLTANPYKRGLMITDRLINFSSVYNENVDHDYGVNIEYYTFGDSRVMDAYGWSSSITQENELSIYAENAVVINGPMVTGSAIHNLYNPIRIGEYEYINTYKTRAYKNYNMICSWEGGNLLTLMWPIKPGVLVGIVNSTPSAPQFTIPTPEQEDIILKNSYSYVQACDFYSNKHIDARNTNYCERTMTYPNANSWHNYEEFVVCSVIGEIPVRLIINHNTEFLNPDQFVRGGDTLDISGAALYDLAKPVIGTANPVGEIHAFGKLNLNHTFDCTLNNSSDYSEVLEFWSDFNGSYDIVVNSCFNITNKHTYDLLEENSPLKSHVFARLRNGLIESNDPYSRFAVFACFDKSLLLTNNPFNPKPIDGGSMSDKFLLVKYSTVSGEVNLDGLKNFAESISFFGNSLRTLTEFDNLQEYLDKYFLYDTSGSLRGWVVNSNGLVTDNGSEWARYNN